MTMTFTYDDGYDKDGVQRGVRKVIASWTSSSGGAASGDTKKISGLLLQAVANPTDGPTDNYDITLTEANGADLLGGCDYNLTNLSTSATQLRHFIVTNAASTDPGGVGTHPAICGAITVTVANAGDTKSGVLELYYKV